ncbi:cancer/testis antigen 55 [Rattus norvegicus]|uniref:Cancer/testis antigen 55 n=3 Tax=Rattus norvegicus TaxID=10116 RepID=A0A8I5ZUT8_RAT|nr:cancer/testis antigen 55 [Rattus norvegicus]|eukprot:XP_228664.3 PREDICTED: cancer/testis antigen 55 [Rattus norvegicus]
MHRLISRFRAIFQRKADLKEAREEQQRLLEDDTILQYKHQVMAGSCTNYDWIHFSTDVIVTCDSPPKVQQKLPAAAEEQSTHGLNSVTVDALSYDHDEQPADSHMRVLFGCVTGDTDYNDHGLSFSLDIACKDFRPYNGDLVEIEFSDEQDTQNRRAILVKPLKHCHINEACVTKMDGRTGVLENDIFFTLDSLKLPSGYVPQAGDVVNVVAVQSIHPNYFWRAVAMTPVQVL